MHEECTPRHGRAVFGWVGWLTGSLLLGQLVGCGTAPLGKQLDRLQKAAVCCTQYSEFQLQAMEVGTPVKLWLGEGAQVFRFDGENNSYFHALRLPVAGNYYLSIQSHFNGSSFRYFKPRLLTFDANWQVVEELVPAMEEAPGTIVTDHFMRAQVKLKRPAVYLVLASARPPGTVVRVARRGAEVSNAHWTGSTPLPGAAGIVYKPSPEGKVVVTAKPYLQALD